MGTALCDAAGQVAVEVGKGLDVKAEQAVTYGRGKSREAMMAADGNVARYRSEKRVNVNAAPPAFTDGQRSALVDE